MLPFPRLLFRRAVGQGEQGALFRSAHIVFFCPSPNFTISIFMLPVHLLLAAKSALHQVKQWGGVNMKTTYLS